jgi:hypothetical protein
VDPNSQSRIRDPDPGGQLITDFLPDPEAIEIKVKKYCSFFLYFSKFLLNSKGPDPEGQLIKDSDCFLALGNMIRDVHPGSRSRFFYPSRIPDQEVKKAPV